VPDAKKYDEKEASQLQERKCLKVNKILQIGSSQAKKHFENWADGAKLLCALGCRHGFVAQLVATFILYSNGTDNNPFSELQSQSFEFYQFDTVEEVKASTLID
jgi:hypothetical protein